MSIMTFLSFLSGEQERDEKQRNSQMGLTVATERLGIFGPQNQTDTFPLSFLGFYNPKLEIQHPNSNLKQTYSKWKI